MFKKEEREHRKVSKLLAQFYASEAFITDLKSFEDVGILMPNDHEAAVAQMLDKMKRDCSIIRWAVAPESSNDEKHDESEIGRQSTARYAYYLIDYNMGIKSPDDVSGVMSSAEKQLQEKKNLLRIYSYWSKHLLRETYESALSYSTDRDETSLAELVVRAKKIRSFRAEAVRILRK